MKSVSSIRADVYKNNRTTVTGIQEETFSPLLYSMVVYHDIIYANFQFSDPVRNGAPVNETVLL